jgi:midasin (ATPase involved in ribosome maturation)
MDIDKIREKLKDWETRVNAYQEGHYRKAKSQMTWHYILGLPTIILTTVTASTIFANLQDTVTKETKLFLIGISLLATVMSAVQTFYSHSKRAEKNRSVAAALGAARREIDSFEMFPPKNEEEAKKRIKELNKSLYDIAKDAPAIGVPAPQSKGKNGRASRMIMLGE